MATSPRVRAAAGPGQRRFHPSCPTTRRSWEPATRGGRSGQEDHLKPAMAPVLPWSRQAGDTPGAILAVPGPPHLPRRRGRPCRGDPARRRPAAGRCRRRPGRGAPRRWSSSTGGRSCRSRWWRRRRRSARGTGSRPASRPARPASRGSTRRWPRPPPAAASPAPPAAASPAWRRRGGGSSVRAPPRRGSAARPPGAGSRRAAGTLAAGPAAAAACPGPARGVRSRRPGRTGGRRYSALAPRRLAAPSSAPMGEGRCEPTILPRTERVGRAEPAPRCSRCAPSGAAPAPPLGAGGAAHALIGGGGGPARMRPTRPTGRYRRAGRGCGGRGSLRAPAPKPGRRRAFAS